METITALIFLVTLLFIAAVFDQATAKPRLSAGSRNIHPNKRTNKGADTYLLFCCVVLYILIAFRGTSVGSDTIGYCKAFANATALRFTSRDYGFTILNYLLRQLTSNERVFLMITALPFPIAIYKLLKNRFEKCIDTCLSVFLLISLELLLFAFAGIRQTIAIAFTIFAYLALEKNKRLRFLALIGIGSLFHLSSVVFLVVILFRKRKFGLWNIVLIFSLYVAIAITNGTVVGELIELVFGDEYGVYGEHMYGEGSLGTISLSMFFIQSVYYAISLILLWEERKKGNQLLLMNTPTLALTAQLCTMAVSTLFRVSYYFSLYLCVSVPLGISKCKSENNKTICRAIILLATMTYITFFNNPFAAYKFGWF